VEKEVGRITRAFSLKDIMKKKDLKTNAGGCTGRGASERISFSQGKSFVRSGKGGDALSLIRRDIFFSDKPRTTKKTIGEKREVAVEEKEPLGRRKGGVIIKGDGRFSGGRARSQKAWDLGCPRTGKGKKD